MAFGRGGFFGFLSSHRTLKAAGTEERQGTLTSLPTLGCIVADAPDSKWSIFPHRASFSFLRTSPIASPEY